MSRQLILRPEAEQDIAEAFSWYEGRLDAGSLFLLLAFDETVGTGFHR